VSHGHDFSHSLEAGRWPPAQHPKRISSNHWISLGIIHRGHRDVTIEPVLHLSVH
ncbi:unnamed protein product, partial [Ectocarpus sp. 8 AP-2014]